MPASSAGPSTGAAASTPVAQKAKRKELMLYEKCIEKDGPGVQYNAEQLLKIDSEIGLHDDLEALVTMTDWLVNYHALSLLRMPDGEAIWRTRAPDTARMIRGFSTNERMVYGRIEEAGTDGIWLRSIVFKSNLHLNTCTKIVKELKKKLLVKEFTGSKHVGAARKMLILHHLEPSADHLGGAFYPDGELDSGFVEAVCYTVFRFVEKNSWAEQPGSTAYKKRRRDEDIPAIGSGATGNDHAPKKLKENDGAPLDTDPINKKAIIEEPKYKPHVHVDSRKPLVPLPPTFGNYPTTSEICAHVKSLGAFSPAMLLKLKDSDFETVLDMLCFDGRMEKIEDLHGERENRWRSVRRSYEMWSSKLDFSWTNMCEQTDDRKSGVGNGVSEAPCGRCPVFDLCTPGGPVNPENCKYYEDWLNAF